MGHNLTSVGGVLTKFGAATLTLNGVNTYTGGTNLIGGTLALGSTAAVGATGAIFFGGGTLQFTRSNTTDYSNRFSGASVQSYNIDTNGQGVTFASPLTSSGGTLTMVGAGTLTLSAANTYTGGTNLNAGVLDLGSAGALGSTGVIAFGGGTLQFSGNNTTDYSGRFSTAASQAYNIDPNGQAVTFASNLTSAGGTLTELGAGVLTLAGVNTYAGGTKLSGGTLALGSAGALGTTGTVTFSGGTLQFSANNTTDYSGRFSTKAGQAYSIDTNGQSVSLATGLTSNGGSPTKLGAGTLTLSGAATYTGDTTINGGTLALVASGTNINSSATTVMVGGSGAGTLLLAAGSVYDDYATIGNLAAGTAIVTNGYWASSSVLEIGENNAGSLAVSGGTVISSDSVLGDSLASNGTVTLSGGIWSTAHALTIGNLGAASVVVTGGTLSTSSVSIGLNQSGSGMVAISGGNWISSSELRIGDIGTGVLVIAGGTVTSSTGALAVSPGAVGTVTVSSGDWSITNGLTVGDGGTGRLAITGGSVTAAQSYVGIGGGVGNVTVSGGAWASPQVLDLNSGSIAISGGTVTSGPAYVGFNTPSATTTATVSGGSWAVAGPLTVGNFGLGLLTVNGGSVSDDTGFLGTTGQGVGTASVTSGHWTTTNLLTVGNTGSGSLMIAGGGLVSAGAVQLGDNSGSSVTSSGTINLNGLAGSQGVLATGQIAVGAFSSGNQLNLNGGILRATASQASFLSNFTPGNVQILAGGAFIDTQAFAIGISSPLQGTGSLTKQGTGTLTLSGSNSYTGGTTISAGTLAVGGNGTLGISLANLTVAAGATLDVSGSTVGVSVGVLTDNGTVALGSKLVTVRTDYANAAFGSGNSFNARANVTGTGAINATGTTAQSVAGGNITGGTTTAPTLGLGNIHEGNTVTATYSVANPGTTGPALRGALQTTVNGGNVTDPRLSGIGVTAANFGPLAPGNTTASFGVTLTGSAPGALVGQSVAVVNNFDNVSDQELALTGAVYRYAAAGALTGVNLGSFHEGDLAQTALTVTNSAAATGGFTESLAGASGNVTGNATDSGSFGGLAAGGNSTALVIGVDTATAGAKTGNATYTFASQAINGSGLGTTVLAPQTATVSANVYKFAATSALTGVNLGSFHEGDVAQAALTVTNSAAATGGFTENLAGAFGNVTGNATDSGSFSGLAVGGNSTALVIGVGTTTAGTKTGSAIYTFASQASNGSGLGTTALAPQTVSVSGAVYNFATGSGLPATVDLGIVHVGDVVTDTLTVSNTAAATGGFTESLNAAFGTLTGALNGSGAVGGLAPGASSSALKVTLNTATATTLTAVPVPVNFTSQAVPGSGLGNTALASQSTAFTAQVNNYAAPAFSLASGGATLSLLSPTTAVLDFGQVVGGNGSVSVQLHLGNAAAAPADALNGSFAVSNPNAAFFITGASNFTNLAAGAYQSFQVGLNLNQLGSFSELLTLDSTGQNGSGYSGSLGQYQLQILGTVAIPEPAQSAALFGAAFLLWAACRRRPKA